MSWLPVAILAQLILGSSAVFDRFLLKKRSVEPWPYAFWLGSLGIFALILLPFGYEAAPGAVVSLALFSGALFFAAAYFTALALEKSEASEALPLIGTISPIVTLAFSYLFLGTGLGSADFIGFAFLVASGLLIFLAEKKKLRSELLATTTAASFFLAASYLTLKLVFAETNFVTGFFWVKIGAVLVALILLANSRLRKKIVKSVKRATAKNKYLYLANRAYAAVGSLLTSGAVYLSNPALVDATQNLRYAVIFALAWLFLKERFKGKALAKKILAVILIAAGLVSLALGEYIRALSPADMGRPILWGVTFSAKFSEELGLDWRKNYLALLDDLKPERLRLIAYWSDIEKEKGAFDFSDLDWQLGQAFSRNKKVILVIGLKVPRWPECHAPEWTKGINSENREAALREYLKKAVMRYRENSAIAMWQLENEPYLLFGECGARGKDFLAKEIEVVRALDQRPILVTDGGEFGLWMRAARYGDVFGTTIYRKVYPRLIGPILGVVEYPLSPNYFRVKEKLIRWLNDAPGQKFIVSELQGEPWSPTHLGAARYEWQKESFSPEYFGETIEYAKAAGFDEYYLWGAEWWYWMKEKHSNPEYWNIVKGLLAKSSRGS